MKKAYPFLYMSFLCSQAEIFLAGTSINHCFCSTQENDEICNIITCESVSYHDLAALVYMTQSSLS